MSKKPFVISILVLLVIVAGASFYILNNKIVSEPKVTVPKRVSILLASDLQLVAVDGLKEGLKEFGYIEGKDVVIDVKNPKGDRDLTKTMAAEIVDSKPDLLISGINRGSNMGEDITYSGTAAGAMEGVLHNIPSIAISQVMDFTDPAGDFTLAQKTIKQLVLKIRSGSFPLPEREFLNVNIPPDIDSSDNKDAKMIVTYAGYRMYANDSHLHRNPRGEEYYWLGLHPLNFSARRGNNGISDYEAIAQGNISITPIQLDMSAYKSMDRLKAWIE